MTQTNPRTVEISIGVLAWNEEEAIEPMLRSLLQQSLFARLGEQNLCCEIFCVANGCTDATAAVAAGALQRIADEHPFASAFSHRVVSVSQRGKPNAWNLFVHELSSAEAKFLFVMDADILLSKPDTLWNMYLALRNDSVARVAVDQPVKDITLQERKSLFDRFSLATSRMTGAAPAQLTGQLYCIRADVARAIYLPRELRVEDGFIKAVVCTDFLTTPANPRRIVQAPGAEHVFEAYKSAGALLRNQKRQMIGQTLVHLLVDKELAGCGRRGFAERLRGRDMTDPQWLQRLLALHLRETKRFWRLFPGALTFRFQRLAKLDWRRKLLYLPAAVAGFLVSLAACWMAHRFLKRGGIDYWPDTRSPGLRNLSAREQREPFPAARARPLRAEKAT